MFSSSYLIQMNKSFESMNRYGETKNKLSSSINDDVHVGAIHEILPINFDMNWSSWTSFPLTPEQIHNSFAIDESKEKVDVTLYISGDKNEDVDEEIENIDVINACKYGLPVNEIDTSDEITSTIGKNDHRDIIPHFSHHVTSNDICEQKSSTDMLSSSNYEGIIELDLALEGLKGITTALDRVSRS